MLPGESVMSQVPRCGWEFRDCEGFAARCSMLADGGVSHAAKQDELENCIILTSSGTGARPWMIRMHLYLCRSCHISQVHRKPPTPESNGLGHSWFPGSDK